MADLDEAAGGWPTGSLIFRPATRAVPLANEQDKQRQLANISGFLLSLSLSLFYCAYRSAQPKAKGRGLDDQTRRHRLPEWKAPMCTTIIPSRCLLLEARRRNINITTPC